MTISWLQAALLGLFACLSSMPGMGGSSVGNYTFGRPLIGGFICGLILGDMTTGILVGCAMQVVYIALVTPGGTVSADVRAVSYIGIPLAMVALKSYGLEAASVEGAALATSFGAMVGTLGTVLFYGTATVNLAWQHIGWQAVEKRDYHKLYIVDMVLPWVSHFICSFIPTLIMCKMGTSVVELIKTTLPMDGIAMKTLFTVGSLLPCVGIAILLKQIVKQVTDFIPYLFGFTLAASMGINLVSATVIAGMFAVINYKIKMLSKKALTKSFHNWFYGHLTCFSQEHMQTFGYLCSMLPLVEDLYDNEDDKAKAMNTYTAFFNTEPQLGTLIVGITAGLEEARAGGAEDVDDETINGLRAGLMGPIAGIGDSLVVGTVIPILLGIAMGMSTGGSPLGAIFYIIVWNLFAYFGMRFLYFKGYSLGTRAVEFLIGAQGDAIRESVSILGGMVIGAVSATWVSVTTSLQLLNEAGEPYLVLQDKLNEVFPGLLTAIFVIACWFLMPKKRISRIKVMLLLVVVAFVGVLAGFFNPGLVY